MQLRNTLLDCLFYAKPFALSKLYVYVCSICIIILAMEILTGRATQLPPPPSGACPWHQGEALQHCSGLWAGSAHRCFTRRDRIYPYIVTAFLTEVGCVFTIKSKIAELFFLHSIQSCFHYYLFNFFLWVVNWQEWFCWIRFNVASTWRQHPNVRVLPQTLQKGVC